MKTIFTLCLSLLVSVGFAQEFFVHTATAATISADATFIDHPSLNNNPNAEFVISHVWNPPGSTGVYNTNNTGLFYSNAMNQWTVYNESGAAMIEDSSYFVYIPVGANSFVHIASAANQGSSPSYTVLSHPSLNGNPNPRVVMSTYYNPSSLRNDNIYGFWFDDITDNQWNIYSEDGAAIPTDVAYMIAFETNSTYSYRHVASAGTITSNWTEIDHPLLNGNPDAQFVFSHNWGIQGNSSNVIVNNVLGAWYTGSSWAIYTEDLAAFPVDSEFDLIIKDPTLGNEDFASSEISFYPNPTRDYVTITSNDIISKIVVYDILGKQIMELQPDEATTRVDLTAMASGHYLAQVSTENGTRTLKLVKN